MNTKKCSEYLQNYIRFSELGNICCFIVFLNIDKLCCLSHKIMLINCISAIYKIFLFRILNYRKWITRSLIETLRNNYYYSFGCLHYSFYFWIRLTSMWPQMNWKTALRFATKCLCCKKYSMNNVDLSFCKITTISRHTQYPNGSYCTFVDGWVSFLA